MLAVKAPVPVLPEVAIDPLQAPLAVQDVASVDDQCKLAVEPLGMLLGLEDMVTVGLGGKTTVTVTEPDPEPPGPEQVKLKVLLAVKTPVPVLPEVPTDPLQPPLAVQDVASVDDQCKLAVEPLVTLEGLDDIDTVGLGTGVGLGVGTGVGLGVGTGVGLGVGTGVGLGVAALTAGAKAA